MGLFSKSTPRTKQVLEFLGLTINQLKSLKLEEIDRDTSEKVTSITYRAKLPRTILKVFNTIEIDFYTESTELINNNYRVHFICPEQELTIEKIRYVTNQIAQYFGEDDDGKTGWSQDDDHRVRIGFFDRKWYLNREGKKVHSFEMSEFPDYYTLFLSCYSMEGTSLWLSIMNFSYAIS